MRRCITARRTGLNEIEEQRTKQLAEVRAWRDELAVAGSGLLVPAEEQAHGGRYLASADFSASSYATIYPSVASGQGRLAQTWKVLSLDNGEYVVEQKVGGTILTADNYSSGTVRGNLDSPQYGTTNVNIRNSQIWILRPEGTGYTLRNEDDGLFGPTGLGAGPVPAPSAYTRPNPHTTPEVLIGTTILPCPLVTDPALGQARKAQESPYYLLKRYGFYKVVSSYDHSGQIPKTESQGTTVGMSATNAREVESTTGISVTAETTNSSSTTVTVERSYPANSERLAPSIWFRSDRCVLERTDGSKVMEWQTSTDQDTVDSVYPPATG
ncbi:hypothetical protein [Streptomyces sp. NPDC058874]|uniref:hypothetical protein n=1 Tax=unclassified Streptomyces TaxID=2593676 RepID=UPI00368832A9